MTPDPYWGFRQVWALDFEFSAPPGERPTPVCMVAREIRSGRLLRLWADDLATMAGPPIPSAPDVLFVAYYASAELGCYLALDWPIPPRILDLFCEFRCLTNGISLPCGASLLGALAYHGLPAIDGTEKTDMRELAMRGGEYSAAEREALLDYCQSDVDALVMLLRKMARGIDLPRALLRGRYMASVARMEWNGSPIDTTTLLSIRENWEPIKADLISRVDADFGVYDGLTFKRDRFATWLQHHDIPWPRLESDQLALDDDTFRQMARAYPQVAPLRELRHTLGEMRLESLAVGSDGRNRCLLSPFRSRSSRNQPSNSKFIFGPSCWMRSLIKPTAGRAVAYVDWSQQEFGIAGVLSGDPNMTSAYASGDPYLEFAKQAGAVPADATKQSHPHQRELFKTCALGVQYGMGPESLAQRLGEPIALARQLLDLHRSTYPKYWEWSQHAVHHAMLLGRLHTVFGWTVHTPPGANVRSLANFPVQANGAEMLRVACCLTTERGVMVCAPVHDALLIEGPADAIEQTISTTQTAMREASEIVLSGFQLATDATPVVWPDRYSDPRGETLWNHVISLLGDRT